MCGLAICISLFVSSTLILILVLRYRYHGQRLSRQRGRVREGTTIGDGVQFGENHARFGEHEKGKRRFDWWKPEMKKK